MNTEDFDGVFRFTNATTEDFKVLWNNKEYTYPAETSCIMIIPEESSENIQSIRKKFAYKLAVREFHKSKEYKSMVKLGGLHPATYDEKVLEPWIQQCLSPLPIGKVVTKDLPKDNEANYTGSKAVSNGSVQQLAGEFKEYTPPELGKMAE